MFLKLAKRLAAILGQRISPRLYFNSRTEEVETRSHTRRQVVQVFMAIKALIKHLS